MEFACEERLLGQVSDDLRRRHPGLEIETWSHSAGRRTDLDGWSMGLAILGQVAPLEFEICVTQLSSQPFLWRRWPTWESQRAT
jgi:hypothetical protein